jgi:arylsulfatase A
LPLLSDGVVLEWEPDQHLLTKRCTEEALKFIDGAQDDPFLLYMPYSMPHIPIYASQEFQGKSPRGLYGDVIEEIDWSVGEVLAKLESLGISEDTLVIFTTDNGPWLQFKQDGGSAGPLRGGKGTNWEGGQRVPCVMRWPGVIPAGSARRELLTTMDLFPTLAQFAGATLSAERKIDGRDVGSILRGQGAKGFDTDEAVFVYYTSHGALAGIRRGSWKLLLESGELYRVDVDISEAWDKSKANPQLVAELRALAQQLDQEIESNARPVAHVKSLVFDPGQPMNPDGTAFQMADNARRPK